MVFVFESDKVKQDVDKLLDFCKEYKIDCYFDGENYEDLTEDEEEREDALVITYDTTTDLILPRSEDDLMEKYSLNEVLYIVEEAKKSKLIDNYKLVGEETALIRISVAHNHFIDSTFFDLNLKTEIKIDDYNYEVDIESEMNSFNLRITMDGRYNKYVPPILDGDLFIRITSENSLRERDLDLIYNAYFFELKSTLDLEIYIAPWEYEYWSGEGEFFELEEGIKLRPLLQGKGMEDLLNIYKSAFNTTDPEQKILAFSRVIEYVSQTVIRKDLIEKSLSKLSSSRVFSPDASYILELGKIFEEHRSLGKDYLAFKITIETCCDVFELVDVAPRFLKKTNNINLKSNLEEQKKALEEIANSISTTRNMFAHAKTNYGKKGGECPNEYLQEFSKMMDVISQQVIRWFSRQQEDTRII